MDTLSVSRLVLLGFTQLPAGGDNTAVQRMRLMDRRTDKGDIAFESERESRDRKFKNGLHIFVFIISRQSLGAHIFFTDILKRTFCTKNTIILSVRQLATLIV
jgi:hypothetical protein